MKQKLYLAVHTEMVEVSKINSCSLAFFSYASTNHAEDNQDSGGIIAPVRNKVVLALSDGAGGQPGGQGASQAVVQHLSEELLHPENSDQLLRASILNAIETTNKALIESKTGGGATACIVSIENNTIRPIHVGDSLIAVVGQRGKLIFKNTEHSPLGYARKSEIIDEKHLDEDVSHIVLNLVGNKEMHIEIGPEIKLKKTDTLLICSDGITDIIPLETCLDIIRVGPFERAANKLAKLFIQQTKNVESKDDATFIMLRSG